MSKLNDIVSQMKAEYKKIIDSGPHSKERKAANEMYERVMESVSADIFVILKIGERLFADHLHRQMEVSGAMLQNELYEIYFGDGALREWCKKEGIPRETWVDAFDKLPKQMVLFHFNVQSGVLTWIEDANGWGKETVNESVYEAGMGTDSILDRQFVFTSSSMTADDLRPHLETLFKKAHNKPLPAKLTISMGEA